MILHDSCEYHVWIFLGDSWESNVMWCGRSCLQLCHLLLGKHWQISSMDSILHGHCRYIYNIYICIPIALCILFALQTAKVFFFIFLDININPSKHMTYESHVSTLLGPLITTPGSVIRKAPKTGSSYRHGGAVYGRCHLPILAFAS